MRQGPGLAALAIFLSATASGRPGAAAAAETAETAAPPSKKERLLREKAQARSSRPAEQTAERARWRKALRRRLGQKPAAVINIYNTWTHETVALDAKSREGPPAELVNRLLRCHFTNRQIAVDEKLPGILMRAAEHFQVPRVEIVSGFRAPKYNLMLRKKGHRVARESEHTVGHAVDFRLPGVTTERLRSWVRRLRLGGVGYYQDDAFVHIDTGPVRYWAE
jgi:uncharacterized protein YcbK (DUF882 family)